MTAQAYAEIGAKLDEENYEWLLREHPEVAVALERQVKQGIDVETLRLYLTRHLGEHRQGMIQRCVGAARWLDGVRSQT